jgi:hypothetical protein
MRNHPRHLDSKVAPQPAQAPLTPLSDPRKLIKEKIWNVSLNFRHLTPLESTNLVKNQRQNAPDCVAFMPNNPFGINASEHEKLTSRACASRH